MRNLDKKTTKTALERMKNEIEQHSKQNINHMTHEERKKIGKVYLSIRRSIKSIDKI